MCVDVEETVDVIKACDEEPRGMDMLQLVAEAAEVSLLIRRIKYGAATCAECWHTLLGIETLRRVSTAGDALCDRVKVQLAHGK